MCVCVSSEAYPLPLEELGRMSIYHFQVLSMFRVVWGQFTDLFITKDFAGYSARLFSTAFVLSLHRDLVLSGREL